MTAQTADSIFIKGVKHFLFINPLEQFWTEDNQRPKLRMPGTACWRGYIATWEIYHNSL